MEENNFVAVTESEEPSKATLVVTPSVEPGPTETTPLSSIKTSVQLANEKRQARNQRKKTRQKALAQAKNKRERFLANRGATANQLKRLHQK